MVEWFQWGLYSGCIKSKLLWISSVSNSLISWLPQTSLTHCCYHRNKHKGGRIRFGRTRALIFTHKWLNRAKIGVLHRTPKNFLRPNKSVSRVLKTPLSKINWTIKSISSGLVTRRLYFLKKYDTKWPKFPPCRNWPICALLENTIFLLYCQQVNWHGHISY